jgi:FkbM family methyltransferase
MNFSKISNQKVFGRLIRLPLRLIPKGMHVPILQGPLRGWKWVTGSSTHGTWLGSYEYEKQIIFIDTVKEGSVVFDIGAHVGFYTLLASKLVGAPGKVIAFEPVPQNLYYLEEHLKLNGCINVEIFPVAVGETGAIVEFGEGPSSSMGKVSSSGNLKVKMVSLDELLANGDIPVPNCIKMDIEGGEMRALAGARRLLIEYHPAIFLSTHGKDQHSACCQFLRSQGYELSSIGTAPIDQTDEILAIAEV